MPRLRFGSVRPIPNLKNGKRTVSSNDTLKVAVIGGDGTGPEVAAEGVKVLKAVAKLEGIKYETKDFDFGGDRYLRTGEILPPRRARRACARSTRSCSARSAIPTSPRASSKRACCWNCGSASTSTSTCGR